MSVMELAFLKAGVPKPDLKDPAQSKQAWQVTKELAAQWLTSGKLTGQKEGKSK